MARRPLHQRLPRWLLVTLLCVGAVILGSGIGLGIGLLIRPSPKQNHRLLRAGEGVADKAGQRELILVSYNVLSDPVAAPRRIPALLRILKESAADIIALQEVAPWFLKRLRAAPWFKGRYHSTPVSDGQQVLGGLFIASRFALQRSRYVQLPSGRGRLALLAEFRLDGRRLMVATMRLEDPLGAGKQRALQLNHLYKALEDADDSIILGDFQFGEGAQPETKQLGEDFKDLWTALRKDAPGYTWDNEESAMARRRAQPGEPSRRADRILLTTDVWRPHIIRILGQRQLAGPGRPVFPAAHFGLLGVLQRWGDYRP